MKGVYHIAKQKETEESAEGKIEAVYSKTTEEETDICLESLKSPTCGNRIRHFYHKHRSVVLSFIVAMLVVFTLSIVLHFELQKQVLPTPTTESASTTIVPTTTIILVKPEILSIDGETVVFEGENTQLVCRFKGKQVTASFEYNMISIPTCLMMTNTTGDKADKNEQQTTQENRTIRHKCSRMDLSAKTLTLLIENASRENDAGKYHCSVSNFAGNSSMAVNLKVKQLKPEIMTFGGWSGTTGRGVKGKSVEIYDFNVLRGSMRADMPSVRASPGYATLNEKIYAIGGEDNRSSPLATVDVFDPLTGDWSSAAPLNTERHAPSAAVLDGKIYAIGGRNNGADLYSVEVYDESFKNWTLLSKGLNTNRSYASSAVVNGILYVAGGNGPSVEKFNATTEEWSYVQPMKCSKHIWSALASVDGKLYAVAHTEKDRLSEVYDPVSDQWSTIAPMPQPRGWPGVVVYDGLIYVIGGHNGKQYFNSTFVYNPKTDKWTEEQGRLSVARSNFGIALYPE